MNDSLYALMLKALIDGGINELTRAAYEYLKLPVMITDAEYNCLAHIPDEPLNDPLWDAIHENGYAPLRYIRMFNDENMMQIGTRQKVPYFLNWGFLADYPRILGNIIVDDTIVGHVAILCASCTQEALEAAGVICKAFAIEFQRGKISAVVDTSDSWTMFLTSLLEGKIHNEGQLKQWLMHLDREVKGYFWVVAAQPSKGTAEKPLLPFIQRDIERIDSGLHPVVYGDSIYLLIMDHKTNEACRKKMDSIIMKLSSMGLYFGISNNFSDIKQIEVYREQASFALAVCLETADARNVYYKDCALKQLLKTVAENLPVQSCIHPALGVLEVYDQKNGTDYLKTLSTYIMSMCNTVETVKELHIHRNTLPYRLDVIERIAGLNLTDRETYAYLLCSFYIRKFI